jgi:hypothetical protein
MMPIRSNVAAETLLKTRIGRSFAAIGEFDFLDARSVDREVRPQTLKSLRRDSAGP